MKIASADPFPVQQVLGAIRVKSRGKAEKILSILDSGNDAVHVQRVVRVGAKHVVVEEKKA